MKAWLVLAALTLATRAWIFGNPVIHIDDQFYLVVGERLLHGDLPYVDIWDRKPVGLFLIYALANWAFADPVIGYQLLAAISVALTSCLLFAIARRLTSFTAALGGAAAYPAWMALFGGIGGQSPVFYNLPMATAAAWTMSLVARPEDRHLTRHGCAIMLVTGIAIQIKYTAVFEGIFFGLSLLWAGQMRGRSAARLTADATVWISCALAPTLAAWGTYVAMGYGAQFVHANFLSIFADKSEFLPALERLTWEMFGLTPLWLCGWIALRRWRIADDPGSRETRWIFAWAAASFTGFLIFGNWFDHYVLPLLLPLSMVAALAFDGIARKRTVIVLVAGCGLAAGVARAVHGIAELGNARDVSRLTALVTPHLGHGCLYVNEEIPILYLLTRSCLPTRFVFPDHLALKRYERALGVDQNREMNNLLGRRPSVIVVLTNPETTDDEATRQQLEAGLRQSYRPAGTADVGHESFAVFAIAEPR